MEKKGKIAKHALDIDRKYSSEKGKNAQKSKIRAYYITQKL